MTPMFRFGAMVDPTKPADAVATAQHAEHLGFSTVVIPDGMQLPSPFVSLAVIARVTTTLHVGTFVLSAALRPPELAAWDGHSLSAVTGGRFEFGIGAGHPGTVRDAVQRVGLAPTTGRERLQRVADTVRRLRALDGDARTPVLMAAGGPRGIALAAQIADIVTLALGPTAGRDEAAAHAERLRAACADAARSVELAQNIFVVGSEVPDWMERSFGLDAQAMIDNDSLAMLRGSPSAMADELRRRRDELGISYTIVNALFIDQIAPVVAELAGQ
ncbi:MAG TPA: LLM class flavin-dependent oxidoreductase [Solirubrobacteraceae bacterium]|nr:LLM class flavin-dependent oxidoreductase [Solirubrobacteraceae bacterium]